MSDFLSGIKYALSGFGLITKPGIRLYLIIPLFVNVVLFAAAVLYGVHLLGDFIDWIILQWAWAEWLTWLLWPVFTIIVLAVVFFGFSIVANLVAAPFNGMLAEAVEAFLSGPVKGQKTSIKELPGEIASALKSEAKKFLYFLTRAALLLLLSIIPFILIIAPILWFLFGAWMLSLEYLDYPLGNKGKLFPEVRQAAAEHRALSIGFGVGITCITLFPVINFVAMPVAVAGATKLTLERLNNT